MHHNSASGFGIAYSEKFFCYQLLHTLSCYDIICYLKPTGHYHDASMDASQYLPALSRSTSRYRYMFNRSHCRITKNEIGKLNTVTKDRVILSLIFNLRITLSDITLLSSDITLLGFTISFFVIIRAGT